MTTVTITLTSDDADIVVAALTLLAAHADEQAADHAVGLDQARDLYRTVDGALRIASTIDAAERS